jgi:hypothetical protein
MVANNYPLKLCGGNIMKIEPDLIKEILQYCEDNLPDYNTVHSSETVKFSGFPKGTVMYHIRLLIEEKYIVGKYDKDYELPPILKRPSNIEEEIENDQITLEWNKKISFCRDYYSLQYLTMNGHQYLNLLKSKAWNTAKGLLGDIGVIFVEGAIKAVIDKVLNPPVV